MAKNVDKTRQEKQESESPILSCTEDWIFFSFLKGDIHSSTLGFGTDFVLNNHMAKLILGKTKNLAKASR